MKYIGNCADIIDWSSVIAEIEQNEPLPAINNFFLEDDTKTIKEVEEYAREKTRSLGYRYANSQIGIRSPREVDEIMHRSEKLFNSWENAGIKFFQIFWDDIFPPTFDRSIIDKFSNFVGAVPIENRVWVSRLRPGTCVPTHEDILPDTYNYHKLGTPVRYICFIQLPVPGQTISFDEVTFYKEPVGDVWQWTTPNIAHSAANSSLLPYYLFHFEGYIPHENINT